MKKSNATSSMVTCLISVWLLYGCIAMGIEVPQPYTVTQGDTLYKLSGFKLGNPNMWKQVVEKNPFLKEKGRMFLKTDGTVVVIIKPNEKIMGLEGVVTPQVLSDSEIQNYLNPTTTALKPKPSAVNASENGQSNNYLLTSIGSLIALAVTLTLLGYLLKKLTAPTGVAFAGPPMRNRLKRLLQINPSLTEMFPAFERNRATEGGVLAEIYQAEMYSPLPVLTEYADKNRSMEYTNGELVYIGVFRNKKNDIIDVVLFVKYCLNGQLWNRMTKEQTALILALLEFTKIKRIATPSGYMQAKDFGAVESWIRDKYGKPSQQNQTTEKVAPTEEQPSTETSATTESIVVANEDSLVANIDTATAKIEDVVTKLETILKSETDGEPKPPSTTEKERQGFHIVGIEPERIHAVTASVDCTETINKKTGEKMVGLMINDTTLDLIGEIEKGSFIIRGKHDKRILIEFSNDGVRMTPVAEPKRKTEKQKQKDARDYIADLKGTKRT